MPRVVESPLRIPLPDVLPVEQTEKPEWFKLRERIVRAKGNPSETGFLLDTLNEERRKSEGHQDFVVELGVLWSLPEDIPSEGAAIVLDSAEELLEKSEAATIRGILHPELVESVATDAVGKAGKREPDRALRLLSNLVKRHREPKLARVDEREVTFGEGPDATKGVLRKFIMDGVPSRVYVYAIRALGDIGREHPDKVVPILNGLTRNKSLNVRRAAVEALGEVGSAHPDEVMPTLERIARGRSLLRYNAVDALGTVGAARPERVEDILPILTGFAERLHAGGETTTELTNAFIKIGKSNPTQVLPILSGYAERRGYGEYRFRAIAGDALGAIGVEHPDRVLPILVTLSRSEDGVVRYVAVKALGEIGKKHPDRALPLLGVLIGDREAWMRSLTIESLVEVGVANPGRMGEVTTLIESRTEDADFSVRDKAEEALERLKAGRDKEAARKRFIVNLIGSRQPVFASAELEVAGSRMESLVEMSQTICREHENVIGLVVWGGTEKGYTSKKRDVDVAIIGENMSVEIRDSVRYGLHKLAEEHKLVLDLMEKNPVLNRDVDVSTLEGSSFENAETLFSGLFLGDKERLDEAKRRFLSRIGSQEWDVIRNRGVIYTSYIKLEDIDLDFEEARSIGVIRTILYTLPDLETMRQELRER